MTRLTDIEIAALARLARTDDGKILMAYMKRSQTEAKDMLAEADSDQLVRRLQGRVVAIGELVEALEKAPDLLVKLQRRA